MAERPSQQGWWRKLLERLRRSHPAAPDPSFIDRDPRTLDHWRRQFAAESFTIECRDMRLIGRDHEGDIFTGPGRIVADDQGIRFFIYGRAEDGPTAFQKFLAAQRSPYDTLEQFRLIATDYRGTTWRGGYTSVDLFVDQDRDWPLTGELQGLSTEVTGFWVAKTAGVELLLIPPPDLPTAEAMETSTRIGGEPVRWSRGGGRQRIEALGSKISFELDPSDKAMWVTATMSEELQPVCAERWLTEPLRILLGALIYPRLMARNFGNGIASVTFLPAPTKWRPSLFGLMQPFSAEAGPGRSEAFWKLYVDILTMIGKARDEHGHPDLEYHEVTRLYEELIKSQKVSHWVISMTLASTIEALVKSIMTESDLKADYEADAVDSMKEHLLTWKGDSKLRSRMLDSIAFAGRRSILGFMNALAREGKLDADHVATWRELRNSVMHGKLTEPWSTEEGDRHLHELVALTHALTRLRIAKG